MVQFKRGIKAGILAGLISGLVFGIILALLNATIFYDDLVTAVDDSLSQLPPELTESENLTANRELMITFITYGSLLMPLINLIPSIIIGLLFAGLFSRIPGKTAVKKGVVVGIILWLLTLIFNLLILAASSINFYFITNNTLGLANQLFFGFLLGKFWLKFKK